MVGLAIWGDIWCTALICHGRNTYEFIWSIVSRNSAMWTHVCSPYEQCKMWTEVQSMKLLSIKRIQSKCHYLVHRVDVGKHLLPLCLPTRMLLGIRFATLRLSMYINATLVSFYILLPADLGPNPRRTYSTSQRQ